MTKQTKIMLAIAGAALAAASQAYAGVVTYSSADLLLNFRDTLDTDSSGNVVTVDVGNVNTFVSAVDALPSQFAVLDSGTSYSTSTYATQFSGTGSTGLINKIMAPSSSGGDGTADTIGFSAGAENLGATGNARGTDFLTTPINLSQLATGGPQIGAQGLNTGVNIGLVIQAIGQGAEPSPNGTGATFVNTANHGGSTQNDGTANSYHTLIEDGSGNINYEGNVSVPVEATPPTGGNIYEALWLVPATGADTYEGYFTFKSDGELDFNGEVSAVPEPSTYGLIAGVGLLALAFRRQIRAQIA